MSSLNSRKWWHATLLIKDRDGAIKTTLSTIDTSDPVPASNNNEYIFAYSDLSSCEPISIPVPAFNTLLSPGYFVFKPNLSSLEDSVVDVYTYQDVVNLNNRRIFNFERTAAYKLIDEDCSAMTPDTWDIIPYQTTIESVNSNVFRFAEMEAYTQLGCCSLFLGTESTDLEALGASDSPTRIWYLLYSDTEETYSLVSYDFGLVSNQLVNRGVINTGAAPSTTQLFDITWVSTDNSLLVLATDGIRRVFPGSSTVNAVLGDILPFTDCENCTSTFGNPFPIREDDTTIKTFEYNWFGQNKIMMFSSRWSYDIDTSTYLSRPFYFDLTYDGFQIVVNATQDVDATSPTGTTFTKIGGFAFSDIDYAKCIINDTLYDISVSSNAANGFGVPTAISTAQSGGLAGMHTINYISDPSGDTEDYFLYTANQAGQQFYIPDVTVGSPILVSGPILTPGIVIGSTTTINGEDTRYSPFPFLVKNAPWLFMVQISASMAGDKLERIKEAMLSMLRTYVRYGDRITVLVYNDTTEQITKDLFTTTDTADVITFIDSNFIASSMTTNFFSPFFSIAQDFTNLKNLIILSDGTCSDCDLSEASWQTSLSDSTLAILSSNPQVNITVVGVNAVNNEKLTYIADIAQSQGRGLYTAWN